MKIALGTTSEGKKKIVEEVLTEIQVAAEVESVDVLSGVSEQPMTSQETKEGSVNRAKRALKMLKNADVGLGIEAGYHLGEDGDYEMFCWTSLAEPKGRILSAQSHKLKLPEFYQRALKRNDQLDKYIHRFVDENPDPISQHVGIIIRDRKPFIQTSVKSVLLYYLIK